MADFEPGAAAPVADAPQVVAPEPTTQAPEPTAGQEGEQTPEAKPERTFTQAELNKIVQKEKAQESRRAEKLAEARYRAEFAERELQAIRQASQPKQPEGEPKLDQFQDYESYIKAYAKFEAKQLFEAHKAETQQAYQQQSVQQQAAQRAQSIMPKVEKAAEKYDDFHDVATSFNAPQAMQEAMLESDIPGELYYHLGSNPAELNRIASLSPIKQVAAILALEAKLKAPPAVTKAPPPIVPTIGQSSVKKATFDLPWKEFVKQRRKEEGRG